MELDEVTIIRQLFEKTIIFFTGREIFGPLPIDSPVSLPLVKAAYLT